MPVINDDEGNNSSNKTEEERETAAVAKAYISFYQTVDRMIIIVVSQNPPLHNIEYILDADDGKTSEQHERDIQDVLTRATNLSKVIDLQVLGIHVTAPISKIIADLVRSYSSKWNQIAFNNCCGEAGQDLIKAALEHSNSVVFHSRRAMVSENRFCDTVFGLYDRGSLFRLWGWGNDPCQLWSNVGFWAIEFARTRPYLRQLYLTSLTFAPNMGDALSVVLCSRLWEDITFNFEHHDATVSSFSPLPAKVLRYALEFSIELSIQHELAFDNETFENLAIALSSRNVISKSLTVSGKWEQIDIITIRNLGRAIGSSSIEEFSLSEFNMNDEDESEVTDQQTEVLVDGFRETSSCLRKLILDQNIGDFRTPQAMAKWLGSSSCKLESLRLSCKYPQDDQDHFTPIAQALAGGACPSQSPTFARPLKHLSLMLGYISKQSLLAFGNALQCTSICKIEILDLSFCQLRDKDMAAFVACLHSATSLKILDLSENFIGPQTPKAFEAFLSSPLCCLETLALCNNCGRNKLIDFTPIANALSGGNFSSASSPKVCTLKRLSLRGHKISFAALLVFVSAFQSTATGSCRLEEFYTGQWKSGQSMPHNEEVAHSDSDDDEDEDDDDESDIENYEALHGDNRQLNVLESNNNGLILSPREIRTELRLQEVLKELLKVVKGGNVWITSLFDSLPGVVVRTLQRGSTNETRRILQELWVYLALNTTGLRRYMSQKHDDQKCEIPLNLCWPFMLERVFKIGEGMVADTFGLSRTLTPTLPCTLLFEVLRATPEWYSCHLRNRKRRRSSEAETQCK